MADLLRNRFIVAHCDNAGVCFVSAKGHSRDLLTYSVIKACHNLASSLNARLKITKTRRSSTQADLIADMLSKADFDAAVELMNQDRDKSNQIWFDTVGDRIEDWRGLVFQESSRSTARFV